MTENVQALYDWFEKLGDGKYIIDVPREHSQRIRKITNESVSNSQSQKEFENKILEIIASPGHTIPEIEKEYANIEHKETNLDEPSDSSELENKSKPRWHYKIELNKIFYDIESQNKKRSLDEYEKEKIRKNIAYVIGRLEKEEILKFWIHRSKQYSPGIWRLTDKGEQRIKK